MCAAVNLRSLVEICSFKRMYFTKFIKNNYNNKCLFVRSLWRQWLIRNNWDYNIFSATLFSSSLTCHQCNLYFCNFVARSNEIWGRVKARSFSEFIPGKDVFMSGSKWERKDTVLPRKCYKFETLLIALKRFFHDWIYHKFEDWSLLYKDLLKFSVRHFLSSGYWTTKIEEIPRLRRIFVVFECVQSSITWRREIVQQVFRESRCKGEASIFKSIVGSVMKKMFQKFRRAFCSILERRQYLYFPTLLVTWYENISVKVKASSRLKMSLDSLLYGLNIADFSKHWRFHAPVLSITVQNIILRLISFLDTVQNFFHGFNL